MNKNLHRLKITGAVDEPTPFEMAESNSEPIENYSIYDSDVTDLHIFDVRKYKITGFCFYWKNTEEETWDGKAVKLGSENLEQLNDFIDVLSEFEDDFRDSEYTWQQGGGYDRLATNFLEMAESNQAGDLNQYIGDLENFTEILYDEYPHLMD